MSIEPDPKIPEHNVSNINSPEVASEGSASEARGRLDRDARREAILDVAREVFLSEGYSAASMSTIAARLGGSKGTLYNYFKSKEELFEAYVRRQCNIYSEEMHGLLNEAGDVRTVLKNWGVRYLTKVTSDEKMREFRGIVAESERSPFIGQVYYESGPKRGRELLAAFLAKVSERGELKIGDPLRAAHMFVSLCSGRYTMARMANFIPKPTPDEVKLDVDIAIEVFWRAYDPKNPVA